MQTKLSNILWPATSFYVTETSEDEQTEGRAFTHVCFRLAKRYQVLYTRRVTHKLKITYHIPITGNNNISNPIKMASGEHAANKLKGALHQGSVRMPPNTQQFKYQHQHQY